MTEHFKHDKAGTIGLLVTYSTNANNKIIVHTSYINTQDKKHNQTQLDYMYSLLDCSLVEVVRLSKCDIWVDEEGIMQKDNPIIELIIDNYKHILAGNLLFSKGADDEGETTWFSLEKDEDKKILKKLENFIHTSRITTVP